MYQPTIGHWSWAELLTRDRVAAEKFYGAVFGWTFTYDEEMRYGMASNANRMVAGLFDVSGMEEMTGIPANWSPYLEVADVDAAVAAGDGAGGATVRPPWDIDGIGRIAVVADSNGAVFNLMRSSPAEHAPPAKGPQTERGDWHWWELRTRDNNKVKTYYSAVTDGAWQFVPGPMPGMDYPIAMAGEMPMGGVFTITGTPGFENVPEHWAGFVAVDDADAAFDAGLAAGGSVVMPLMDMEGVGRFGMIADPEGAAIGIMTPAYPS